MWLYSTFIVNSMWRYALESPTRSYRHPNSIRTVWVSETMVLLDPVILWLQCDLLTSLHTCTLHSKAELLCKQCSFSSTSAYAPILFSARHKRIEFIKSYFIINWKPTNNPIIIVGLTSTHSSKATALPWSESKLHFPVMCNWIIVNYSLLSTYNKNFLWPLMVNFLKVAVSAFIRYQVFVGWYIWAEFQIQFCVCRAVI